MSAPALEEFVNDAAQADVVTPILRRPIYHARIKNLLRGDWLYGLILSLPAIDRHSIDGW
ncbi:MAG: hypothetical protein AAGA73_16985 [Pseudomonadota bacterium]